MIDVSVYKQSNYPISSSKVRTKLKEVLAQEGLTSDFSVSIAFVGDQKMDELVDKYYKDDPEKEYLHPILTFASSEINEPFVAASHEKPDLGEIIISFPQAVERAKESGKLIDDVVMSLIEHGALHLLGRHHE